MLNLAGNPECDAHIREELGVAKIPVVTGQRDRGEVPSTLWGKLGGIAFTRAWSYWVANGPVPIGIARAIYADPIGRRDVRIDGHCGARDPDCAERFGKQPDVYHIDSVEGLVLFADAVRDLPPLPPGPPTVEELQREVERLQALIEGNFKLTRLHYEEGKPFEMEARGAPIGMLAAACRDFLGDAKNYVEISFSDDIGKLSVVVQRPEGETPAQKAARLTARLDAIEAMGTPWPLHEVLSQLAEAADHLLGAHDCDAHGYEGIELAMKAARAMVKALRGPDEP